MRAIVHSAYLQIFDTKTTRRRGDTIDNLVTTFFFFSKIWCLLDKSANFMIYTYIMAILCDCDRFLNEF